MWRSIVRVGAALQRRGFASIANGAAAAGGAGGGGAGGGGAAAAAAAAAVQRAPVTLNVLKDNDGAASLVGSAKEARREGRTRKRKEKSKRRRASEEGA